MAGKNPVTSALQRSETSQQSRITADSFRLLTARLKPNAATVDVIPALARQPSAAPVASPAQAPKSVEQPSVSQSAVAPQPVTIPAALQGDSLNYDSLLNAPAPVIAPPPVVVSASVEPEPPVSTPVVVHDPVVEAPRAPEPQVVVVEVAATQPVAPQPIAPEPFARESIALPEPVALEPTFESIPQRKMTQPAPQPQGDQGLVIASSRISSVLARQDHSENLAFNLPPILPPPEPPAPKPVVEAPKFVAPIPTKSLPQLTQGRRKIAPSDPELEQIMRMVAALPSLDERAAYLEEAARFELEQSLPVVPNQPTEDLEALAMQHVRALKNQNEFVSYESEQVAPEEIPESEIPYDATETNIAFEHHVEPVAPPILEAVAIPEPVHEPATLEVLEDIAAEPAPLQPEPVAQRPRSSILKKKPLAKSEQAPELSSSIANLTDSQAEDLARSLLDMMSASVSSGLPQERALAADTLLRILPRLQMRPLIHLSERVAMMESPPILLVGKLLADDRIEISGPLIENAITIADQDLLEVIEEGDIKKLRLLARRRKLTRAITDRLVTCGNNSVLLTLVRNSHADISHDGFIALAKSVENEPELLAPLCTRADLPPPQAFELFWLAPTQLRRYLLSRFLTDSEMLTKILKITLATQGEKLSAENFPGSAEVREAIAEMLSGDSESSAEKLGAMAQISAQTVQRIFSDSAGEPQIALLKALGMPRQELDDQLITLQQNANGMINPTRDRTELCNLFDTLSFNKARILLTYWDWATLKSGPYAAVH